MRHVPLPACRSGDRLYHIVEDLAQRAELPMLKVRIIMPTEVPNARLSRLAHPSHAAIAATKVVSRHADDEEIRRGVPAHEMSLHPAPDILKAPSATRQCHFLDCQYRPVGCYIRRGNDDDDNGGIVGSGNDHHCPIVYI